MTTLGDGSFVVNYGSGSAFDPTSIVLSNFSAVALPGDYNHNNVVDAADYVLWRNTLGQTGSGLAADGNGNGAIDSADFDVWRAHFGKTFPGSGSAAASRRARTRIMDALPANRRGRRRACHATEQWLR